MIRLRSRRRECRMYSFFKRMLLHLTIIIPISVEEAGYCQPPFAKSRVPSEWGGCSDVKPCATLVAFSPPFLILSILHSINIPLKLQSIPLQPKTMNIPKMNEREKGLEAEYIRKKECVNDPLDCTRHAWLEPSILISTLDRRSSSHKCQSQFQLRVPSSREWRTRPSVQVQCVVRVVLLT